MATRNLNLYSPERTDEPTRIIRHADLRPIDNLKEVFREIRDYFAGNVTGITRDESIAQNMMRLLFCKIYDETTKPYIVEFANRPNEDNCLLQGRVETLFSSVKEEYSDLFEPGEEIELEPENLSYIVSKLESYSILDAERDVISDGYEELIGTSFRGGEGQFFTPRNVVDMMIDMLDLKDGERIIDPACGSGGFLVGTLKRATQDNLNGVQVFGIDKDAFLTKIAKAYVSLTSDNRCQIYCENSLYDPFRWREDASGQVGLEGFDAVLTNPPFGAKIPVVGEEVLGQYELGMKWRKQKGEWQRTDEILAKQAPQVLFIERCIRLLRKGGRLGIVLPEGIFGNPSDRYIWEYITSKCSVTGIVSLPQETFQPSTHTKTSVLFLKKEVDDHNPIFMAIAASVGHNKNGKPIPEDDVPTIADNFRERPARVGEGDRLGYYQSGSDIKESIYVPEYYNPEIRRELETLRRSGKYKLVSVEDLVSQGILQIKRGNEIGSRHYGTGDVPFVRTSDIVNWEIKFDPIKSVSEDVYEMYRNSQNVREGDILFVSDGTFLIGRTAMVTRLDLKIIIQSHLKKIRVLEKDFINPYYLFYLLNSKIVRKQIDSKTFVQATISTIGNRIEEVILPVITDRQAVNRISDEVEGIITRRADLRQQTMRIINDSV